MQVQERDLINQASVDYNPSRKKWYCQGVLNIGSYEISIEKTYHDTIDEAVTALKETMARAVKDFDTLITK